MSNLVEAKAQQLYLNQTKEGDPGWEELLPATRQGWITKADGYFITCAGQCGKKIEEPEKAGWQNLPITNRYRCWECTNALAAAGGNHEANAGSAS